MSETTTRRAPGRPKKAAAPAPVQEEQHTPKATKKATVVRREKDTSQNREYELIGKGGIVTMLPQKGVTVYDPEQDTVR